LHEPLSWTQNTATGQGVVKNHTKAAWFYQLSCEGGIAQACEAVKKIDE
jgi:hypothetical protein